MESFCDTIKVCCQQLNFYLLYNLGDKTPVVLRPLALADKLEKEEMCRARYEQVPAPFFKSYFCLDAQFANVVVAENRREAQ